MKRIRRVSSMKMQLLWLLAIAGICSSALFLILFFSADFLISRYFPNSELQTRMTDHRAESLQDYIDNNSLAAKDSQKLLEWCGKQPMVLMEIYRDNKLIFNSKYLYEDDLSEQNIEVTYYDWYSYYEIEFSDGKAELLIYSDESYLLRFGFIVISVVSASLLYIILILTGIRRTIKYIYILHNNIEAMGNGDFTHPVSVKGNNELGMLAKGLDNMRQAILEHRDKELTIIQQNNDMITNLSHDLRTPLTKIMIYAEIIKCKKYENERQLDRYLDNIYENGIHMKEISEQILQYSLTQGDVNALIIQPSFLKSCFCELLSEMTGYLSHQGFKIEYNMIWQSVRIEIIEFYLRRIIDNITSNIEKYADPKKPVSIKAVSDNGYTGFLFSNSIKDNVSTQTGTNVGLINLSSMMNNMNGKCKISVSEEKYEITLLFRIYK